MPDSRFSQVVAVVVAVLLGAATYLALTEGMQALGRSDSPPTAGPGNVPEFLYEPPNTVPTTADYGPVGPVAVVFADAEVLTGIGGKLENPWVAVSSQTGDYRALVVPHSPEPARDAVAVAPDGRMLAWGYADGVVLYDPVEDRAVERDGVVDGVPVVGPFSPDGSRLVAYDGSVHVLDSDSGDVLATVQGVSEAAARQAVWTPDGSALTYVDGGRLVIQDWQSGRRTDTATTIGADATLAWQPAGRQLAAMKEVRGVRTVDVFDVAADGRLTLSGTVEQDGYAQQELLGFTGDARVTVTALTLETATIPLVFNMSTEDAFPPTRVMQLPGSGGVADTLQVAAEPLAEGSVAFDEPNWPASDLAKLVASIIVTVFALGLYLTRRPRYKARALVRARARAEARGARIAR
ncbi:MAG TPA: hypothetical protein VFR87_14345 [Nocardioidaceae bacterium]|nr:hypothetical protein [Nocardioidaceae bacterium]